MNAQCEASPLWIGFGKDTHRWCMPKVIEKSSQGEQDKQEGVSMGESYRKPTRPQADGAGNQYEIAFSDEIYDNTGGAIAHGAGQRCERNHETHFGKAQHEVLFNERK